MMNEAKERDAFEKAHKLLDLEKKSDLWGQLVYVHPHIDSIWHGWKARAALAQPELEPVAWMYVSPDNHEILRLHKLGATAPVGWAEHPLYTAPPQRQPLTQEQILSLFDSHNVYGSKWVDFARAIEKAHGIGGET